MTHLFASSRLRLGMLACTFLLAALTAAQDVSTITFGAPSYIGGSAGIKKGTLWLTGPVASDTLVAMEWGFSNCEGPPEVTVKAGRDHVAFSFTTPYLVVSGFGPYPGEVSATLSSTVTVPLPTTALELVSISDGVSKLVPGYTYTGRVTLNAPCFEAQSIDVSSDYDGINVPSPVIIPAGQKYATFPVEVTYDANPRNKPGSFLDAQFNGSEVTLSQNLMPITIKSLVASSPTLTGGSSTTATVTLNVTLGTDLEFTVYCAKPFVTVPTTVTVPAGSDHITFVIDTSPVVVTRMASVKVSRFFADFIGATTGYTIQKSEVLTINP